MTVTWILKLEYTWIQYLVLPIPFTLVLLLEKDEWSHPKLVIFQKILASIRAQKTKKGVKILCLNKSIYIEQN